MKVLIFSDIHFHNWSYGASYENGWNSRLLDQKKVCDQLVDLSYRHNVDYVIFCGDLFHTHGKIESGPLYIASDLFSRFKKPDRKIIVLVGNHDLGIKKGATSVDWLAKLDVKIVHDTYINDKFGFIAYTDNEQSFKDSCFKLKEHNLDYWFLHQGVKNVPVGSDFVVPNEFSFDIPENLKMVFTGHYHNHTQVIDRPITIIGSPMQFNWSDTEKTRGCIILDTWTHEWKFHPLDSPKFIALKGLDSFFNANNVENNFVKITEEIPIIFMDEIRSKLMEAGARAVEFSFKASKAKVGMTTNVFDINSLIKRYINLNKVDNKGQNIADQLREGNYAPPAD